MTNRIRNVFVQFILVSAAASGLFSCVPTEVRPSPYVMTFDNKIKGTIVFSYDGDSSPAESKIALPQAFNCDNSPLALFMDSVLSESLVKTTANMFDSVIVKISDSSSAVPADSEILGKISISNARMSPKVSYQNFEDASVSAEIGFDIVFSDRDGDEILRTTAAAYERREWPAREICIRAAGTLEEKLSECIKLTVRKYSEKTLQAFGDENKKSKSKDEPAKAVSKKTVVPAAGITDQLTNMDFILIEGGEFRQGDLPGDGFPDERPVHQVSVRSFYMGKYEVTQGQWKKIMGNNPSISSKGDSLPVEGVSWDEAQEFISKLNRETGMRYRLPTEAEWEFAARSRGRNEKWSGTSSESEVDSYAWTEKNSGGETHDVGRKKPNGLGLYDMSGNVEEWVSDYYGATYYRGFPKVDPSGPETGSERVMKGGSFASGYENARTFNRGKDSPLKSYPSAGFRLALDVAPEAKASSSQAEVRKEVSEPGVRDAVTGMELVFVNGGVVRMGTADGFPDEQPVHFVFLHSFYMGKYEVTQGQWKKVMGNNPSMFAKDDDRPVESVSWDEAQEFIAKLNRETGRRYRLPTEAEWEFAARSGGRNEKWSGTSSEAEVDSYAWTEKNSGGETHEVGRKKPNSLGLFDMSGNVEEWTADYYSTTYYASSPKDDPKGPSSGDARVIRGGSFASGYDTSRAVNRGKDSPSAKYPALGFRLVLDALSQK